MGKIINFFNYHTLVAIIFLGIIFKFFLWLEFTPPCCGSDEGTYESVAKHLVNDHQFLYTINDDSLIWQEKLYGIKPPLYPFFIAGIYKVFGTNPGYVRIFQIMLSAVTGYLIYFVTKNLTSKKVGLIALIIFSFFWDTAHMSLTLMSENLHWFLLMLLTFFLLEYKLHNKKYFIPIGVITGLIILNRPASLILLLLITTWMLWKNIKLETFKNLFIIYIFLALTILPWIIRNYNVYGQFVFVYTDGALNMWMGNYPQSGGSYNIPNPEIPGQVPILHETGVKAEIEHEQYYYSQAFKYMLANPIEAVDTDIRKIFRTFYLYRPITLNETNVRGTWPLVRPKSLAIDDFWELVASYEFALLMITSFAGVVLIKKTNKEISSLLLLLIAGHLIVVALTIWTPRYTTHIYTLMIPFSAIFISRLGKVFK